MISRLDLMSDLLPIFVIFDVFRTPFWGVFWDKYVKTWSMQKIENNTGKGHAGWEVGGRGGGQRRGGRLRLAALQVLAFGICLARPATSDEVRRISVACGEFRPRRLKQNLAVVIQK